MPGVTLAGTATAAGTPANGKVLAVVTEQSDTKAKIVFTGAIGDYGTAISEDANGKVDPNGAFEKITLKHGGFLIDAAALNKKLESVAPSINRSNCSISLAVSGVGTLEKGTGAYAGISGRVTIDFTLAGITAKTSKGCDMSNNAPFYGLAQAITLRGAVRLGS